MFLTSGRQPCSSSTRLDWLCPFWQLRWRAVKPPLFFMYTLALAPHRALTVPLNPFQAASCSAVLPENTENMIKCKTKCIADPTV